MSAQAIRPTADYPKRPYDLVREVVLLFVAMLVVTIGLAAAFSSPDRKAVTLAGWAQAAPDDVVATAVAELAGSTTSAGYGPPYNDAGSGQHLGFFSPQKWAGITQPLDSANDLVIAPLSRVQGDADLTQALTQWRAASSDAQTAWATAYGKALGAATGGAAPAPGDYGPVPLIADRFEKSAASGQLDGFLAPSSATGNDQRRLLLLADGSYLADQAQADHLTGSQWGMMNEAGNYPGQPWLWLYTFWYQVPAIASSPNADAIVAVIMVGLTLLLVLVPFIPGLRGVPRLLRIHRLIWRG